MGTSRVLSWLVLLGCLQGVIACASPPPWEVRSVTVSYPGDCQAGQEHFVTPDTLTPDFWTGEILSGYRCAVATVTVVPTNPQKPLPEGSLSLMTSFKRLDSVQTPFLARHVITHPTAENTFNVIAFVAHGNFAFELAEIDTHGFEAVFGNDVEVAARECKFYASDDVIICPD